MNKFSKFKFVIFAIVVLAIFAGVMYFVEQKPVRNVLLISIDTCRADHLSCYGFKKKTTPNIDALASKGILFKNAISPIGLTLPSHSSMLTGTYPPYHGIHDNLNNKLSESNITLAEILNSRGYATGGVISAYVLDPQFGIAQGFDYYNSDFKSPVNNQKRTERRAEEASQIACEFIEENSDKPFFFFLHYYDPHTDYDPPEPFASMFPDDPYSGEIAYVDHHIQKVVDKLKELELYDSTLIVIVSDHGEDMGEHGETEHGYFIYQSTQHVPFIICPPGLSKPKKIDDVVSLVDVTPTVLSYLDISIPGYMQGKDLRGYQTGKLKKDNDRKVYCESFTPTKYGCNPLLAIMDKKWKYIDTTNPELYDLEIRPLETNNFIDKEAKRARLMKVQLQEMMKELIVTTDSTGKMELDDESRKKLESLGYVGTASIDATFELDKTKSDPKDLLLYHEYTQQVTYLLYHKKFNEAHAVCEKMLREWPEMSATYFRLVLLTYDEGVFTETIKYGKKYIEQFSKSGIEDFESITFNPDKPLLMTHKIMGSSQHQLKEYGKAIEHFNIMLQINPNISEAHTGLGDAYFETGKLEKAIEHWNKTLQFKPNQPDILANIAGALYKQGKVDSAVVYWNKALALKPDWPEIRENLKKVKLQQERDALIESCRQRIKFNPDDYDAYNEMAQLFYIQGKIKEAIENWQKAVEVKPNWAEAHNSLATALYRQEKAAEAIEHWQKAVELKSDWAQAQNNLAWILATIRDENLFNPTKAIQLAEKACELTEYKNPQMMDTLSVAYASAGRFTDAIKIIEKALEIARNMGLKPLQDKLKIHLKLYEQSKPYLE